MTRIHYAFQRQNCGSGPESAIASYSRTSGGGISVAGFRSSRPRSESLGEREDHRASVTVARCGIPLIGVKRGGESLATSSQPISEVDDWIARQLDEADSHGAIDKTRYREGVDDWMLNVRTCYR